MSVEILSGKGVIVRRPDAEELLDIRNGKWTYDQLKDWFDKKQLEVEELYKTTTLPKTVNYEKINELYQKLLKL
jgi:nitrogen fixation protein